MAMPSSVALQGMNKPHLTALFHVIEAAIYIPLSYVLVKKFGGTGAAAGYLFIVLLDALLLQRASCRLFDINILSWYAGLLYRGVVPFITCGVCFLLVKNFSRPLLSLATVSGIALSFIIYMIVVWGLGFDKAARAQIKEYLRLRLG